MKSLWVALAFCSIGCGVFAAEVDYLRDVKPVFAEHCYRCHGASQQKAGLRLDTAASALKGGEKGPELVARNPAESLLLQVVKGTHSEIPQMPYKKPPLAPGQIALIEQWIKQGAAAPPDEAPESSKHWAFLAPKRPALPKVKDAA